MNFLENCLTISQNYGYFFKIKTIMHFYDSFFPNFHIFYWKLSNIFFSNVVFGVIQLVRTQNFPKN